MQRALISENRIL